MSVNKRFDKIEETIDRIIFRKLEENVVESTAAKVSAASYQNQSYASSLRTNPEVVSNFESVIRTTKNNELVQEKKHKKEQLTLLSMVSMKNVISRYTITILSTPFWI